MSESPDQHVDFLIVGHGIAGALLTYELQQAGKSVLVIDTPHPPGSIKGSSWDYQPGHGPSVCQKLVV
jgi:glycine/D-amino acid oxidase-like deaminating enzyme